jgi:2-oxoglutarate ferredoxin oxidoreductase subunit beta
VFNNQIYGLTKGQYSPTSEVNKITKSSPQGSIDHPFNPAALALGADATFVGRTMDRDPKHMQTMIARAEQHQGTSFLEIYQNCNIFNDGAFEVFTEKSTKLVHGLYVEQGKPLTFGANSEKGIRFDGMRPEVVEIGAKYSADDMWIHDEKDFYKAQILTRLFDNPSEVGAVFPRPFGVFYTNDRPCYEQMMSLQIEEALAKGAGDLDKLIRGKETWEIK